MSTEAVAVWRWALDVWKHLLEGASVSERWARYGLVLLAVLAVPGEVRSGTTPESNPAPEPRRHYWESVSEARGQLGVTYQSQSHDDPYRGFKLSSGLLNEFPARRAIARRNEMHSFIGARKNEDQTIWSLGLGADVPYTLAWGPARLVANGSFGLEYRTDEPNDGLGVFLGVGLAAEVWLGRNVVLTVGVERQFAYQGNDNNQVGFGLRFVGSKLPALIPMV